MNGSILGRNVFVQCVSFGFMSFFALSAVCDGQIVPLAQTRQIQVFDDFGFHQVSAPDFGPFNASVNPVTVGGNYYGYVDQTSSIGATAISAQGEINGPPAADSSFSVTFLLNEPMLASYFDGGGSGYAENASFAAELYSANSPFPLTTGQYVNGLNGYAIGRSQDLTLPAGVYTINADVFSEIGGTWVGGFKQTLSVTPIPGGSILPTAVASSGNSVAVGTDQIAAIGGGTSAVGGGSVILPNQTTAGAFTSLYFNVSSAAQLDAQLGTTPPANVNFFLSSPGQTTQMWDLHDTGTFTGSATVTLHYNPTLVGGVDPSQLQIWHFTSGEWVAVANEVVDASTNTITFTTDSFSPFVLGVVPEPSSAVLAALGLITLVTYGRQRTRRARSRMD